MKPLKTLLLLTALLLTVACSNTDEPKQDNSMTNEECLICGEPIEYLAHDTLMECVLCHRQEQSKSRCSNGHYVCNDCHTSGMDSIVLLCLGETSKSPIDILEKMMSKSFCHIHGPEHHVLVGAALLTAYHNAVKEMPEATYRIDLSEALVEMMHRGKQVPGGACGYWGACGAALSAGMFVAIVTQNTPLATDTWRLSNLMTAKALESVANNGGPRCCKRDSYLSVLSAIAFVDQYMGVKMEQPQVTCTRSHRNNQCIGKECPFSPVQ